VSEVASGAGGSKSFNRASPSLRTSRRLSEAVTAGVAYGALLCWLSTCLVASFRGAYLAMPYWSAIPGLRTDTCGAIAFVLAAVALMVSQYLRLGRRHNQLQYGGQSKYPGPTQLAARAVSETTAVLATGLVVYISINAVTHPVTLSIHATHFASWPSEGALRVLALCTCVASVGALRYLKAGQTSTP
jgi:hypothetical protein